MLIVLYYHRQTVLLVIKIKNSKVREKCKAKNEKIGNSISTIHYLPQTS